MGVPYTQKNTDTYTLKKKKKKSILNLFLISYIFLDTFLLPRSTQNKLNEASMAKEILDNILL